MSSKNVPALISAWCVYRSLDQVAVVVGGIAEMFMVSKTTETLYLRKRKNFTKIAIEVLLRILSRHLFFLLVDGSESRDSMKQDEKKCRL